MKGAPTFDDIFATLAAASVGDATARILIPNEPVLEDTATRLAIAVNVLLDDLAMRADERVALEAARLEAARLRELNEFKSNLLNVASHELNTPIGALKLQLFLLKKQAPADAPAALLTGFEVLERNVERLAALVSDTLDIARIESGKLVIRPAKVDLRGVLHDVMAIYRPLGEHAGVDVRAPHEGPVHVWADESRINQVLGNLVGNAIKFTRAGGRVEVEMVRLADTVRVAVRDTGLGLTAERISRLFLPFSQVHEPTDGRFAGTGLGLYISHSIVRQHGGRLWAESEGPNRGSTFVFTLPSA